jgi:hypothetical protein
MSERCALHLYQEAYCATKHEIGTLIEFATSQADRPKRTAIRPLRSGHAACNFVVGDTDFNSFQSVLEQAIFGKDHQIFVDLGCGRGEVVAAAMLHNIAVQRRAISKVVGIELMHYKMDECIRLSYHIEKLLHDQESPLIPEVELLENDFLCNCDWVETADVVYACATCFSEPLLMLLYEKLKHIHTGAVVILLDHRLVDPAFRCQSSQAVRTSWGSGIAHIYIKELLT